MSYHYSPQSSYTDVLQAVAAKQLIHFLTPYAGYLKSRGLELPGLKDETFQIDYQALTHIIRVPNEDTPNDLTYALHCIQEMSTLEAMESLLEEAEAHGITIDDIEQASPADVAIQFWMHDRHIIERKHAEEYLVKPCTFLYYQAGPNSAGEAGLSSDAIKGLERDLDKWFQKTGSGCRVYCYPRQDGIWFMVCHAAALKRERCIENGEPSCVCYHPERHDVLIYQPATHELQIDTETNGDREIYRKYFGRHLFSDDRHFPGTAIYTLDPLANDGTRSLVCSDVPGMESVTLHKIEICWGGPVKVTDTLEAKDNTCAFNNGKLIMPMGARIIEACFLIKFSDGVAPRMVWVRPSNIIRFERDSDWKVVENWLRLRGFVLS